MEGRAFIQEGRVEKKRFQNRQERKRGRRDVPKLAKTANGGPNRRGTAPASDTEGGTGLPEGNPSQTEETTKSRPSYPMKKRVRSIHHDGTTIEG